MLNNQGFDLWADGYDQSVKLSEESDSYPFAGYKAVLGTIFNEVMQKKEAKVLDIGFGTGVLTAKLYENGHRIDGVDFSKKMIEIAQEKMPAANLVEWDISKGLPDFVKEKTYDFIISTYTLHHLADDEKILFIKELLTCVAGDGKTLIGDIAFGTEDQLEACREKSREYWDEDEYYFVSDKISRELNGFCKCEFFPKSHCGGVFVVSK
ncbi:class I SAM-dependent methyltransferase [Bacillus sp. FJAT-27245]|uniref:class I SAM-dependent methyltransferase n=1 Tax=Bacillus sp. FJAT-27245 TaxID=1684144 RepID=UPI0006A7E10C|nr:class I SAM-dependent methyltransferase [Bacillus sp. FJAT-27245]